MKKRKLNYKNVFICTILVLSIIGLYISTFNIIKWAFDKKNTNDQITEISKISNIKELNDNENEVVLFNQSESIKAEDPYWDYIKLNMIDVDFSNLKSINNDTIGWIQVNGTNINYPFVQTSNNDYYLIHSFNKNRNSAGWVFMDYRNNIKTIDQNTIIYAHSRLDKTMFGTLKEVLKDSWINNKDNHIVKIDTEYASSLWQIFSVYYIPTTTDYLKTYFLNTKEHQEFLNLITKRSLVDFNTTINTNDKILTLSTCYNKNEKIVMHAKLIKNN